MSDPTRDPQPQKTGATELQSQRTRLHQAWAAGASIEDTATLMNSLLRLLPPSPARKERLRRGKAYPDAGTIDIAPRAHGAGRAQTCHLVAAVANFGERRKLEPDGSSAVGQGISKEIARRNAKGSRR